MGYCWLNNIVLGLNLASALQCQRIRKVNGPIGLKYIEGI